MVLMRIIGALNVGGENLGTGDVSKLLSPARY
jgi:hypothetical protein